MEEKTVWTIGHSTLPLSNFIEILLHYNIKVLADIRRFPGSRRHPHFNKEELAKSVRSSGIEYHHFEGLGGRRNPRPDSVNTGWRHAAFRGYADYMETPDFKREVGHLIEMAHSQRLAYMCSEAVWWSCHRRLVSDYLKARGWTVMHIMNMNKAEEHPWTSPARLIEGKLIYKAEGTLDL